MSGYLVGAYPASLAHRNWQPELEQEFFTLLASDGRIDALELPWLGKLHPHDNQWLLRNFPAQLDAVITGIPYVMGQIGKNQNYGLASTDDEGRNHALTDVKEIFDNVNALNDSIGHSAVTAVELHCAPRQFGNVDQLAKSLEEIGGWNWESTQLNIEHCDAYVAGQNPEKGFLSLQDEIAAIQKSQTSTGIFINWGRSAIEFRDADRVVEHIELAKDSGLLRGLIFSGASDKDGLFGYPWIDAHHPFKKDENNPLGDPQSLLTPDRAKSALDYAGQLPFVGVKMGWPASVEGAVAERYQMISNALTSLDSLSR